jgi:molybdopterin molybdotransferase
MIRFERALGLLRDAARPLGTETVAIDRAEGRVLAEPVRAAIRAPASDVSTMDGYAVRGEDVARLPARLAVAEEARPGSLPPPPLEPGTCVRVLTGGPLPPGADRVVIQEVVRREGNAAVVEGLLGEAPFTRAAGSDFEPGDVLVPAGRRLRSGTLVAAAAGDIGSVEVWRMPRLLIIATGDELEAPGSARSRPGAVPDSISPGLAALARSWGADVIGLVRVTDEPASSPVATGSADIVLVTGGASVGPRDHAKAMFGDGLELIFSRVAIKPGKPVWLGRNGDMLVLGLPGNPTSALVTGRLFLAPLLAVMTGLTPEAALDWRDAALGEPLGPAGDRETFSRGRFADGVVRLLPNQDSGAQRMLADATLLVRRPIGAAGFAAGDRIQVLDF